MKEVDTATMTTTMMMTMKEFLRITLSPSVTLLLCLKEVEAARPFQTSEGEKRGEAIVFRTSRQRASSKGVNEWACK